ncbi:TRAP transporter substrate-binding protein DctP [Salinibacterium sp. ZJ454]|uniref:TRAP transporter substrate-binding protein DctP n=1 Tax=Salinibacterium sp. ZJ454 TaxID=2708339 RepID=UPI0014244857|nr:TRAP transporter substrate-binding protein DctP [Salinibacterium sp. ZJ454]
MAVSKTGTRAVLLAGTTLVAVLLAGCTGGNAAAPEPAVTGGQGWSDVEPVELTVSNPFPQNTAATLLESWMAAVTEETEGKVTFDYYPNSTLHPLLEGVSAIQSGLTDVTYVNGSQHADQLPIALWDSKVLQSALADFGYPNMNIGAIGDQVLHYSDEENVARDEMISQGFVPILPMLSGPAVLTCSEPFETPSDLAGRQVRITDAVAQGENEALGMTGVFLAPTEQYEALQRGVIDCAVNAATVVLSAGLLEVTPWVALTENAPTTSAYWVFSSEVWDSLIPEIQQVLLDVRYEPYAEYAQNTLTAYQSLAPAAKEAGGGIVSTEELDPLIREWWADQPDPVASAPSGISDPQASVDRTNTRAKAWRDFSVDELGVPANNDDILEVLELGPDVVKDWDAWTRGLAEGHGTP